MNWFIIMAEFGNWMNKKVFKIASFTSVCYARPRYILRRMILKIGREGRWGFPIVFVLFKAPAVNFSWLRYHGFLDSDTNPPRPPTFMTHNDNKPVWAFETALKPQIQFEWVIWMFNLLWSVHFVEYYCWWRGNIWIENNHCFTVWYKYAHRY